MRRLLLFTLLVALTVPLFGGTGTPLAAQTQEQTVQNVSLQINDRQVASEQILAGQPFAYRNESWMRLGSNVDHRMRSNEPTFSNQAQNLTSGGSGQAGAPAESPTISAVNLETGDTIKLPYGIPVVPLMAEVKLTPFNAEAGAQAGPARPMRAI